jgi:hypothetical protein
LRPVAEKSSKAGNLGHLFAFWLSSGEEVILLNDPQFECILQPDGLWAVWDNAARLPATVDADDAITAEEGEALAWCSRLNAEAAADARRAA